MISPENIALQCKMFVLRDSERTATIAFQQNFLHHYTVALIGFLGSSPKEIVVHDFT